MADTAATIAAVTNVAIRVLPEIIAFIRARRREQDPNAPTPTDAEVLAGLQSAARSTIAKDDAWLAAHPTTDDPNLF